jgi:hypothetical protein
MALLVGILRFRGKTSIERESESERERERAGEGGKKG